MHTGDGLVQKQIEALFEDVALLVHLKLKLVLAPHRGKVAIEQNEVLSQCERHQQHASHTDNTSAIYTYACDA
jgi:hypothetical protein